MPAFMTLSADGVLTINSQSNNDVKLYEMEVTMTTPDSGDQKFQTVNINLSVCVLTGLTVPNQPTTLAYSIFALNKLTIDLGSPGF